jgi:hypothetical protein
MKSLDRTFPSFKKQFLARAKYSLTPTTRVPLSGAKHSVLRRQAAAAAAAAVQQQQQKLNPPQAIIPSSSRSPILRFLNPWKDLAEVTTDDTMLSFKIESVTRTFGVVAALMCSLSAAAIFVTPFAEEEQGTISQLVDDDDESSKNSTGDESATTTTTTFGKDDNNSNNVASKSILEHVVACTDHVSGTSLLVSWGIPARATHDLYASCCAASFYSSVSAMGLSAVINAWLAATPLNGTRSFLLYHSWTICLIPGLLAMSTGLSGVALFIGLDRSRGVPVSYIGLVGTLTGGVLMISATLRGMIGTYKLLTPLVNKKI